VFTASRWWCAVLLPTSLKTGDLRVACAPDSDQEEVEGERGDGEWAETKDPAAARSLLAAWLQAPVTAR
jgi:hypothetical protein